MGSGGGGGGGFNPFQDVTWNKPFGNSAASNLVGGTQGSNHMFDNVSMTNPLGTNSFVANATGHNTNAPLTSEGKDKKTGEQVVQPTVSADNGGVGVGVPQVIQKPNPVNNTPATTTPMAFTPGAGPRYLNNQSEMDYRNAYMKSLAPNTNFNINAESSPYKNISSGQIGNALASKLGGK